MAARNFRVNRQIRVPQIRLIDQDGNQVGIVRTDEARRMADEHSLDLVEVQPQAVPPVCRIVDYGKLKYEQKKRDRASGKAKKHTGQLKELRVRPAIDTHDLSYRLKKGREFLEQGHKVQVVCVFRGRQLEHPQRGYDVMMQVAEQLEDLAKVETKPRLQGRRMTMLLTHK